MHVFYGNRVFPAQLASASPGFRESWQSEALRTYLSLAVGCPAFCHVHPTLADRDASGFPETRPITRPDGYEFGPGANPELEVHRWLPAMTVTMVF